MPTVEEQCIEFCGGIEEYNLGIADRARIAPQLSTLLPKFPPQFIPTSSI